MDEREAVMELEMLMILVVAVASGVVATTALKLSDGFTQLWPMLLAMAGYVACYYLLSLTMRSLPVGVVYAASSGLSIIGVVLVSRILCGEVLGASMVVGICLIVAGVVVLGLFSETPR